MGNLPPLLLLFVLKYKQYLYVLVDCVYCAEEKDMSTSSRVLALGEKNAIKRYFSEAISH
jgi:hypothetical protein